MDAVLVIALFDWVLVVFSSLAGAAVIVQTIGIQAISGVLVFIALAGLGVVTQAGLLSCEQGTSSRGYAARAGQ